MWRRSYLFFLAVRLYFALSPSYLHPDENFQGPEIITGEIFPYPSHRTWEWTSSSPIRSVFPLWPVYGIPMMLLKWVWEDDAEGAVSPEAIYYALRVVMLILSFVVEDWAIHELVHSPRQRRQAVVLVASSYVTWTLQTHTFSNSVEAILVLWSLVLMERIVNEKRRSSALSCITLSFVMVFGVFNRITFPAFILIPCLQLAPDFLHRPLSLLILSISTVVFILLAVAVDTAFYIGPSSTTSFRALFTHLRYCPVITPLNNLLYNSQTSNVAAHGLHPRYQHFLANLPQLLGPALALLIPPLWPFTFRKLKASLANPRLASALSGTLFLSIIPHQEPRFLLPCVPLLLTCVHLPPSTRWRRAFWISWLLFNSLLGLLMGIYHQGGIIPSQLAIPAIVQNSNSSNVSVFWWKTYPPPTYLLGSTYTNIIDKPLNITTIPLMGIPSADLLTTLSETLPAPSPYLCTINLSNDHYATLAAENSDSPAVYLVAPLSAHLFDNYSGSARPPTKNTEFLFPISSSHHDAGLRIRQQWTHKRHFNLDDLDFAADGVVDTLRRVVGRRGLVVFSVDWACK